MDHAAPPGSNLRTYALVGYVVYGLSLFSGLPMLIGAAIALFKRGAARGTVYHSHFDNMLTMFWVSLVVGLIGWMLTLVFVGFAVLGLLWVWVAWRTVKGLGRLGEGRPYDDRAMERYARV
ncbi:MAG TPA: hypothetical protein VEH84_02085 [Alphaproteobacteria bacterium]|nr:hypothetical protein [Alphaproteobacteria bacterium]